MTRRHRHKLKKKTKKTRRNSKRDIELIRMFKTPFTLAKYTPKTDFYSYINYQWIHNQSATTKAKYYVQMDSFRMTQELVYYELMDIVKDYIHDHSTTPRAKALRAVYHSFLNLTPNVAANHANTINKLIDDNLEGGNLLEWIARINSNEVVSFGCPLVWTLMPDDKNSKIYRNYISAPQLSAYDYDLYFEDAGDSREKQATKRRYKRHFLQYVGEIFDACAPTQRLNPADVWDVEYDLLIAMGCDSIKDDNLDGYNLVTKTECMTELGFDWENFAHKLGYKKIPQKLVMTSKNYTKCVMSLMQTDDAWKSQKWRAYWTYIYMRQLVRFHSKWRYIYYDFNKRFIGGQKVIFPKEIYPVYGLSIAFNTLLTHEYVRKNPRTKECAYVKDMADRLKNVFIDIVERNTWLSPSTKRSAILKLKYMKLIVGMPDTLREDPVLNYDNDDAWGNMIKISTWRFGRYLQLSEKAVIDIPIMDWNEFKIVGTQAYMVNAYYTPTQNSIYVPMGYIQKPFVDLDERGIEYNLAQIGFTLAHEMSHSLDDLGSKYDHLGNLHNWWTAADRKKFNAKVKDVIRQYESAARRDGIIVDASPATGESLADISGMAIVHEYLKNFQNSVDDIVPIRQLSFQALYTYLAIASRQQVDKKAEKLLLVTNPHPLDKYRVNCPLARIGLFQSVYNIKSKDPMYWHDTSGIW